MSRRTLEKSREISIFEMLRKSEFYHEDFLTSNLPAAGRIIPKFRYSTVTIYLLIKKMAIITVEKKEFDVLKTYGNEIVISINKKLWNKIYSDYIEDQDMEKNKTKLIKKYDKSIKSGFGLKI